MKKIISVVLALVCLMALATSAMAEVKGTCSFDKDTCKVSWNVTEYEAAVTIFVGNTKVGGTAEGRSGHLIEDCGIAPGTYTVYGQDISGVKYPLGEITIPGAATEEPTEAPTEEPTEAPTEAPTEEPTEAPTEEPTEAPTEEPVVTEEPTKAPVVTEEPVVEEPVEDDDVPKTGDASVSYIVLFGMIALSAAVLVARRFAREK